MFKKIILLLFLVLFLVACSSPSYTRTADGMVTAKGGNVALTFGPDGKTVTGETFTAIDGLSWAEKLVLGTSGNTLYPQLLEILRGMSAGGVAK
jgi:ABC-type transport system substrate-binding protein